jgi:alkylation response protein AidB-like acyl-CoA dehydrogenase
MDLKFTDDLRNFQLETRAFIEANLPQDLHDKVERALKLDKSDYLRWQDILADKGWLAYNWPQEHGGTGWSPAQCYIFQEELGRANAPRIVTFGLNYVGPVIYTFGNDEQKARYLGDIRNNKVWWCQGYSEPGAGSDLASLQTRAVRDGDHYIVNGTKTWTTMAQWADQMFCLVRTDPQAKKQEGISFVLIDMHQPGVEVHPIVTIDGGRDINTVYLTDVRVPVANLIGEPNKGWTYAKFLLGHERSGIARIAASKARLEYLKDIARHHRSGGKTLAEDADFMQGIAATEIELMALEFMELRGLMNAQQGQAPGSEANMLKIRGTDVQQKITELLMKAMGYYAAPFVPEAMELGWNDDPIGPQYAAPLAAGYFNMRKASIYGGTNEIQRGIIAKMVLDL